MIGTGVEEAMRRRLKLFSMNLSGSEVFGGICAWV